MHHGESGTVDVETQTEQQEVHGLETEGIVGGGRSSLLRDLCYLADVKFVLG